MLDTCFLIATIIATLSIIAILFSVLIFVINNGLPVLTQQFSTTKITPPHELPLLEMVVSTVFLTLTTLILVVPFAAAAAIYLHEFAKNNLLANLTRFSIQILASIPSIVYGLFGMLIFVRLFEFGMSIIAGAGTLAVMLIPIIMTQTENALQQVPAGYREGSASLGATHFETLKNVILPSATPGIFVAIILSIGRIVSESAALIFTIGTFVQLPVRHQTGFLSIFETGTTLTVRALIEFKEYGNLEIAAAIGLITICVTIGLNLLGKFVIWVVR